MAFGKLITTLKALTIAEQKQLAQYLKSPYFDIPPSAFAFYNYLNNLPRFYSQANLQTATIAAKLPSLNTAAKQAQAATALLKVIADFIAQQEWQQNTLLQSIAQLNGLQKHHLFDLFKQTLQKAEAKEKNRHHHTIDTLYYTHLLEEIKLNGFQAKLQRHSANRLDQIIATLDRHHALKKLRYLCETISRHQWFATPAEVTETEQLLLRLQPLTNTQHPYIFLFVHIFKMLCAETYEQGLPFYNQVKNTAQPFSKNKKMFPLFLEISGYALNFCLAANNRGFKQAGKEYMWWTELLIQHQLLLENNKIQPIVYRNIAGIAIKSGYPLPWVKNFIEKYRLHLPAPDREKNLAFARGLYYYALKNFSEAGSQFSLAAAPEEPIHNGIVRRWFFMSQYESRTNALGLDTILATFEKYVWRKPEDLHQFKPLFAQFIFYAKKLLKATDTVKKEKLLTQLNHQKYFPGKDWLLLQVQKK